MKKNANLLFLVLTIAVFVSVCFVSAIILKEGDTTTIFDEKNDEWNLQLKSVNSQTQAIISLFDESNSKQDFPIEAGKNNEIDFGGGVEIFVNDIFFSDFSDTEKQIVINDFVVLDEARANAGDYLVIGGDNNEYSFNLKILSSEEAKVIINSEEKNN